MGADTETVLSSLTTQLLHISLQIGLKGIKPPSDSLSLFLGERPQLFQGRFAYLQPITHAHPSWSSTAKESIRCP